MKQKSIMGVVLLTAALSLAPAGAALAEPTGPVPPPPPGVSSSTPLSTGGESTSAPDGVSPQSVDTGIAPGCSGALDYVHKSGGTASVHGRTTCPISSRNYVSLSIGYIGWFGERYAVSGNDGTATGGQVASSQAKSVCSGTGLQTWRAFGYHSSVIGGTTYYGNTGRDGRFTC